MINRVVLLTSQTIPEVHMEIIKISTMNKNEIWADTVVKRKPCTDMRTNMEHKFITGETTTKIGMAIAIISLRLILIAIISSSFLIEAEFWNKYSLPKTTAMLINTTRITISISPALQNSLGNRKPNGCLFTRIIKGLQKKHSSILC